MIRVGFVLSFVDTRWLGGINYLANLLKAISSSAAIKPVLFVPVHSDQELLTHFPDIEIVETPLLGPNIQLVKARKALELLAGNAFFLKHLLRKHRIDVLSHSGHLGRWSKTPTIGWIPDFQHVKLPNLFKDSDLRKRNKGFSELSRNCTRVLVSSYSALEDYTEFSPATAASKARVLRFATQPQAGSVDEDEKLLTERRIHGPYFHLPNQFWVHKNHGVVLDAVSKLKADGVKVTVICTGSTHDTRHPDHFSAMQREIERLDVADSFSILGIVPSAVVHALMRQCVAVINPSYFEGWSTTVEEAKACGKCVLLSDINVHREQAPYRSDFFPPNDPSALAQLMLNRLEAFDRVEEGKQMASAGIASAELFRKFGEAYERIALEAFRCR